MPQRRFKRGKYPDVILPLCYNTGIATYVWVLSNRKAVPRRGKVQLIDASQWFQPLRKNLGKKNCELSPALPHYRSSGPRGFRARCRTWRTCTRSCSMVK